MTDKEKVRRYSCLKCGAPFDAYPPDDLHDLASVYKPGSESHVKVNYKCNACGEINVIYWMQP